MADDSWDTSDFLKRYASHSNPSPPTTTHDEEMNSSVEEGDTHITTTMENRYNDDTVFCTPDNLEERLQYLNQELTILGFSTIYNNENNVSESFNITKLVNCTYDLLKRHSRQLKVRDDIEERLTRSNTDNDQLLQTQDRLKQENETLKRDIALSTYREKELGKKCTCLQQEIKNEKEEKRKMKLDVDGLRKQFYHESKRLEKEISRLKDKVHQSLSDRSSQGQKIAIDILNPLLRSDGKRSRWKVGPKKDEEEMYRQVIANYEEKEKVLLMENEDLRDSLTEVQRTLITTDSPSSEMLDEEEKVYQMPFHTVKEDVNSKLQYLILSLKNKIEEADEKSKSKSVISSTPVTPVLDETYNKELQHKVEQYKAIIADKERTIQGLKDGYTEETFEKLLTVKNMDK